MFKTLHSYSLAFIALAMLLTPSASAHDFKAGDLMIDHPWTRATPTGAKTAAGYATITNSGSEADRLIGGSADGADTVEVHKMAVENNIMKMRKLEDGLEIKPGETVELKPGSFHLMLMGLNGAYKAGNKIKGTMTFEKAGTVEVEFSVEAIGKKTDHGEGHKTEGHGADAHHNH